MPEKEELLKELASRVEELEKLVRSQGERLLRLEKRGNRSPRRALFSRREPVGPTVAPREREEVPGEAIEQRIGGTWLNRIGIVAFVLGMAFFLKYAFDNRWIGETGRVVIGLVTGTLFLWGGEHFRRKQYRAFSQGLTGGGIALLYLSIFAAFGFYRLLGFTPAFGVMVLITAAAALLAVRYDSVPVAALGVVGGFLTPFLLSLGPAGGGSGWRLFTYLYILNLGVLAISYFKHWRIIDNLAFALSQLAFLAWTLARGWWWLSRPSGWGYQTVFFAIFLGVALAHHVVGRKPARAGNLLLILANAAVYFAWSYLLISRGYPDWRGFLAVGMALLYFGLGGLALRFNPSDRNLTLVLMGLALSFLTLAVPLQLKGNWITTGWAVEGVVLLWVGLRTSSPPTRSAGLAILGLTVLSLLRVVLEPHLYLRGEFIPLWNWRAYTFLVVIAALGAGAYLYRQNRARVSGSELRLATGMAVLANLLLVVLFSLEVITWFDRQALREGVRYRDLENAKQLGLSVVWTVYSAALVIVGFLKRHRPSRLMAMGLFGVTIAKVFLVDLARLEKAYRFVSFIGLGGILIGVSYAYQRYRGGAERVAGGGAEPQRGEEA